LRKYDKSKEIVTKVEKLWQKWRKCDKSGESETKVEKVWQKLRKVSQKWRKCHKSGESVTKVEKCDKSGESASIARIVFSVWCNTFLS